MAADHFDWRGALQNMVNWKDCQRAWLRTSVVLFWGSLSTAASTTIEHLVPLHHLVWSGAGCRSLGAGLEEIG